MVVQEETLFPYINGADFVAVCQAVWGKDDPGAAVRRFNEVFALI